MPKSDIVGNINPRNVQKIIDINLLYKTLC